LFTLRVWLTRLSLVQDIAKNLAPTIAFVTAAIGQSAAQEYIVTRNPHFLACGLKRLNSRKERIATVGLAIDEEMLSRMANLSPSAFNVFLQGHGELP